MGRARGSVTTAQILVPAGRRTGQLDRPRRYRVFLITPRAADRAGISIYHEHRTLSGSVAPGTQSPASSHRDRGLALGSGHATSSSSPRLLQLEQRKTHDTAEKRTLLFSYINVLFGGSAPDPGSL
jgi:hypothetical protein